MNVSMEFISSIAINDAAVKNAASLVRKNSFSELIADAEGTFLGGKCAGAGARHTFAPLISSTKAPPFFGARAPVGRYPANMF